MRSRRWAIILAFLLAGLAVVFSYHRLGQRVNGRLQTLVQSRLEPLLAAGWSIDSVKVQWGAVHLLGLRFRERHSPYELSVSDVRIGYSFFQLLKHRFKPRSLPQQILLTEPELTLHFGRRQTTTAALDSARLSHAAAGVDFVRALVISNGRIVYADTSEKRFEVVRRVSGYVYALPGGRALARLAGALRGSERIGVEVTAKADFNRRQLDTLRIRILDVRLGGVFPFLLPSYLAVDRGRLAGQFELVEEPASPYGFDLNGKLSLTEASVRLKGARISADSLDFLARIRHWNVEIERGYARLNGSPVVLTGAVYDLLNPRFRIRLSSEAFDVGRFQKEVGFDFPLQPRGAVGLDFQIRGDYRNPTIAGAVRADTLRVDGKTLAQVSAEMALQDSVFALRKLRARGAGLVLSGSVWFDFARSARPVAVHLAAEGSLPEFLGLGNRQARADSLGLELRGHLTGGAVSGLVRVRLANQSDSTVCRLSGRLKVSNRELAWSLRASEGEFEGHGLVRFGEATGSPLDYVEVRAQQIEELVSGLGFLRVPLTRLPAWGVNVQLAGRPDRLESELRIRHGLGLDRRTVLLGIGSLRRTPTVGLQGDYQLVYTPAVRHQMFGDLQFDLSDSAGVKRFVGRMNLGGGLRAEFSHGAGRTRVALSLARVPLEQLLGVDASVLKGLLGGAVHLTVNDSVVTAMANLSGTEIFAHGVGPFDLELSARGGREEIAVDSLWLSKAGKTWLQGRGFVDLRQRAVEAFVRSDSVRLLKLLNALGVGDSLFDATCSLWARAEGSLEHPTIVGELLAANGRFWREPFDLLRVAFGPESNQDQLDTTWVLHVGHLMLARTGVYDLEGWGRLPLSKTGHLALNLRGTVDVLHLVADLQGFLRNPVSRGRLQLRVGGSWSHPQVLAAEVRLEDGTTEFSSILPPVKDVRGLVRLEPGNFLHLVDLSGKMGGEPFRISTVASVDSLCDCHLEPFRLPGIGLTIGIFEFESGPKGVPLNLYGLQEKGNFGKYEFLGLNPGEKFWLAGPWEKPVIRGLWKLRDVEFQYPFVAGAAGKRSWFLDMLKRAEWNLRLLPVKDVRYVRYIPSALDNVYVNLLIDERGEGILLTGSPADGTFRLVGRIESTRGMVEYLDMNFQVENAGAEFDRHSLYPVVWGRARTTVTDTTGIPANVYLTLQTEDLTEERSLGDDVRNRQRIGRWNEIRFKLSSDNPNFGTTEGQILGALGYSSRNLRQKAAEVVGISADNMLFRPLYRPVERSLAKVFGLDMVRFSSRFARNFIEWNLSNQPVSSWYLLRSTRWQVGKYLSNNLFLNYTGEIEAALPYQYHKQGLGLRHTLGLEYRISPDLVLEMIYDYDSLLLHQKSDRRILLRHYFPF